MRLWTIGFTKTSAKAFFGNLRESGATRLIDVRLNNVSQLSGFAKKNDLAYFLRELAGMEYEHLPILAPTAEMLDGYRKRQLNWDEYAGAFNELMQERQIEQVLTPELVAGSCLLCSEDRPERCHRRLVAEYLQLHWGDVDITHLS